MDVILKMLTSRQTALKLFMNVVYGYTGASFSGRMPCSDIADSVVETGKTILKNSLKHIEEHKEWRAHVIYGDTDSMFVLLKGRSIDQAIEIGQQMAREITKMHPYPIELKFEKVYCPFIPLAKKRYTGYKYEKKGDKPTLEGKGLETVRRDGVEACVKIMNKCLIELFENKNVSSLKNYLHKQYSKILKGHVNIRDFIFAKEVRLGTYVSMPPAALVSLENTKKDPMLAPKYRERVEYIVISGKEGSRIKDLVVSPPDYIKKHNYKLNSKYYIENVINSALNRIFESFKIDIHDWYQNIPKGLNKVNLLINDVHFMGSTTRDHIPKSMNYNLEKYYRLQVCILCFDQAENTICTRCLSDANTCKILSLYKIKFIQKEYIELEEVCRSCSDCVFMGTGEVPCDNIECNIFYRKLVAKDKVLQIVPKLQKVVESLES